MPRRRQDRAALGVRLSPDDPLGTAARTALGVHLRALQRQETPAHAGEVEGVHQLRVATRRLRATLRLFGPVLPTRAAERVEADLEWVGGVIGGVRDLDVLDATLTARGGKLVQTLQPSLRKIEADVAAQRAHAQEALVAALDGPRYRRLVARLAELADSRPRSAGAPCRDAAGALVRRPLRAVLRAGRRLDDDPASFHRLRVRVKRLRYALETLEELGGTATRALRRRLAELQEVLGDQHDALTQQAWLYDHAEGFKASPRVVMAVGALHQAIGRRERRLERRARAAWKRFGSTKKVRAALDELRPGGTNGRGG